MPKKPLQHKDLVIITSRFFVYSCASIDYKANITLNLASYIDIKAFNLSSLE